MDFDLSDLRNRMQKTFEVVASDVATIRTGRATPALIEDIVCEVYEGTQRLKLKELASISVADAQTLVVTPWDQTILDEIFRCLQKSGRGLIPNKDANLIRIRLPPLTSEQRQEFVKLLNKKLEAGRVMIRQVRRDKMVEIRQAFEVKELNEDEKFRLEQEVQRITDEFISKIDELGKRKEKELLSV